LLKAVKDADEIENIRASLHLCDVGQAAVLKYAKPGMTEIELFTKLRGEMDAVVGKRIPMMADLVSGQRTFYDGGNPTDKVLNDGDLIISDLTPCLNGYWGDTCNTMTVGKPTAQQIEYFKLIEETLQIGIMAVKPGISANSIDQLLRNNVARAGSYGHHSGHGIGTNFHEEPRIVPYNNMVLVPNMVFAMEPALYINNYGIRLEHVVLVTNTGCEVLTKFQHCFQQT